MLDCAITYNLLITERNADVSPENVSLSSRHEVLTAVLLPIQVLQDVTLFRSVKSSGRFEWT
jgi:hypothetical protein